MKRVQDSKNNDKILFAGYRKKNPRRILLLIVTLMFLIVIIISVYRLNYWNLVPKKFYSADHFHIETIQSKSDYDNDGIDDFTDIMLGARNYVESKPTYKSAYYEGGYPPSGEGVCTDVIWEAFQNAGYSLKDLVDADISSHPEAYPAITKADPNIDFRRVRNLLIYFKRNAKSLTLSIKKLDAWQPGDIVIYHNHIAIISNKRDSKGIPYIIHNGGQPVMEEDALTRKKIIGHFRWILKSTKDTSKN